MPTTTRTQRRYDHRLRILVQTTGDLELAIRHGVPRSTARGWRTETTTEVVSLDVLELDTIRLQHEVILLRRRIARLGSLSEHARHGYHGSEAGGLLYRSAQHPPAAFGVSWTNAR